MRAHNQDSFSLTRKRKESASFCYEAYRGKLCLLREYEGRGIEDEYVRELRRRVKKKEVELRNRGIF
jgi:hypothetical protein